MPSLELSATDQAHNRRVWSELLRRPDWNRVPGRDGEVQECAHPWDVGLELATEHWPSSQDVIDSDEHEYQDDVEEAILVGCYGVRADGGSIDPSELPDRLRNGIIMAAWAAQSAPPYDDMVYNVDKNSIADPVHEEEWSLQIIWCCLIGMWRHDPSPMRGVIMSPPDVARLVADILDVAPQSLLADPAA